MRGSVWFVVGVTVALAVSLTFLTVPVVAIFVDAGPGELLASLGDGPPKLYFPRVDTVLYDFEADRRMSAVFAGGASLSVRTDEAGERLMVGFGDPEVWGTCWEQRPDGTSVSPCFSDLVALGRRDLGGMAEGQRVVLELEHVGVGAAVAPVVPAVDARAVAGDVAGPLGPHDVVRDVHVAAVLLAGIGPSGGGRLRDERHAQEDVVWADDFLVPLPVLVIGDDLILLLVDVGNYLLRPVIEKEDRQRTAQDDC